MVDLLLVGDAMGNVYTVERTFYSVLKSNVKKVATGTLPFFSLQNTSAPEPQQ